MTLAAVSVDGTLTAVRVRVAHTWSSRAVGLLATRQLEDPCGLWLRPCNAVHMFFMRYPIDVVYLASDGRILKVVRKLDPWRMSACVQAASVLELRAGLADRLGLHPRRRIEFHDLAVPTPW